jgi:hypothetical protein
MKKVCMFLKILCVGGDSEGKCSRTVVARPRSPFGQLARVCLKIALRQMCVPLCGRFGPNERGVVDYVK